MKQSSLQLCPTCNTMKRFDGDMCVRCEGESTKNDSTGEMDWDSAVAMAAEQGSMLQWIQMQVWEYMDTPKLKRDGVDLAKRIYDEVANQAIAQERERTKQVVRQAQIAMGYIEDDEQADWCLNRFNALLDDDLKLDIITNNHEDHKE